MWHTFWHKILLLRPSSYPFLQPGLILRHKYDFPQECTMTSLLVYSRHLLQCPQKLLLLTAHTQQALTCPNLNLEVDVWAQTAKDCVCNWRVSSVTTIILWSRVYPASKALIHVCNSYPLADVFGQLYRHSLLAVSSWSLPISQVLTASNYLELPRILVAWIINFMIHEFMPWSKSLMLNSCMP